MSRAADIRDDLIADIQALVDAAKYTRNDLTLEASNLPIDDLKALETPKLWFVTQGGDEVGRLRDHTWEGELGVQLILKMIVDLSDTTACDQLETLLDELKITSRQHGGSDSLTFNSTVYTYTYHSNRVEALRDAAGTPYSYGIVREASVFEGVFTNIYTIASD